MTFEKFDIVEKEDEIHVVAQIAYRTKDDKRQGLQKIKIGTADIVSELSNRNVSHGRVLNTATLKNYRAEETAATWIFEKKTTKTLDKSAEKVILTKEKKLAPKKKSKAKKTTSK